MKIESSIVSLSANTSQRKTLDVTEQLTTWVNGNNQLPNDITKSLDEQNILAIKDLANSQAQASPSTTGISSGFIYEITQEDMDKMTLLSKLIEKLTGKKLKFFLPERFLRNSPQSLTTYKNPLVIEQLRGIQRHGWGIDYQKHERIEETATMNFDAQGIVKTSDGKTINIDLSLNVSRSFVSEKHIAFKAGDALKDPLVINFSSASAELTSTKFSFDIDSDGHNDNISFVKSGSGFLVFDKNKDGKINNGSELFGPETGSGFMELRAYDSDNNGWIDENDAIYDQLQIWTKNEKGEDQLFAIGQKGIGAIYLNAIASPFELKDSTNALQGKIQQSSVFLFEKGGTGTIQHVDLSI